MNAKTGRSVNWKLSLAALLALAATVLIGSDSALAAESITAPDTAGIVGYHTSMALDASGYPVVSYFDSTNGDLKVMHCDDRNCAGGGESFNAADVAGDVGRDTSLALDASGRPIISYYRFDTGNLKVMHCNDPNCTGGGESIASPDTAGDVGRNTSLALDSAGRPVVSYFDATGNNLKLLHCGNANCTAGNSVTTPDSAGQVGAETSLALDAAGRPVISYYDWGNGNLKVMHCNDPNCAGGGESITAPDTAGDVGSSGSLALDGAGRPVISYYDYSNGNLKVMHCNDPNCAGGGESITAPDNTPADVGMHTSLALDGAGRPVISYFDLDNGDLKILRCGNPNCTGGNTITVPDSGGSVGQHSSLVLNVSGYPVVSYFHVGNGDLKVLRCNDWFCGPAKDSDGDQLLDVTEAVLRNCPSSNAVDSDFDSLWDGVEAYVGSNLCVGDTDRDGLLDGIELYLSIARGGACPSLLDRDSDGDGWKDGQEQNLGTNICNRFSHP